MKLTIEESHALTQIMYNKSLTSVRNVKEELQKKCRIEVFDIICNIADYRRRTKLNYYGLRMTAKRFKDVLHIIQLNDED